MNDENTIESYLIALRRALKGLSVPDCNEIVSEIGVHLRESIGQAGSNAQSAISHLGPAEELAAQYRENLLVQRTAQTVSPWLILHGALRLARTSVRGFLSFLLALTGYGTGAALILSAGVKPFFPGEVGLWIGPGVFNFGWSDSGRYQGGIGFVLATDGPLHEVLGWWYIPVALAIGGLFVWGTTKLVRALLKRTKFERPGPFLRRPYLGPIVSSCVLFTPVLATVSVGHSIFK